MHVMRDMKYSMEISPASVQTLDGRGPNPLVNVSDTISA